MFFTPPRPRLDSGIPFLGMLLVGCLPLPLKRCYYKLRGARLGRGVRLGMFSYITSPQIVLADNVKIAPFTFIRTRTSCIIGARSEICAFTAIDTGMLRVGEDSSVGEQVVIGGLLTPRSSLVIGHRTKILPYSFINPTESITIGDEVCIGGATYIFTHGTWQSMLDGFPGSFGPVTIEDGAWLAWRVFVMPNVTIGKQATIGAGSVVTHSIPARTLAVGAPARAIKAAGEYIRDVGEEQQHRLLLQWLESYAELLTFIGKLTRFMSSENGAALHIKEAGKISAIHFYRQTPAVIEHTVHLVLSLAAINGSARYEYDRNGIGWFDIASRECGLVASEACEELRTYLLRYGLRFKAVSFIDRA